MSSHIRRIAPNRPFRRQYVGVGVDQGLIKLAQRIREEFEDAPGLRMNVDEASRFWGLDETTAEQVLARLLGTGFLSKDGDERYRDGMTAPAARHIALRGSAAAEVRRRCA